MSTIRRSLVYTIADSYLAVALQLAGTVVIARLLTPTETGVFAIAAVFAAFASTFRDFGVAEYLIQEKELTTDKIRAALAANIVVSWAMAVLLFFGSEAVSAFYRHPGIGEVMRIQAANFIFIPFGAVTMAYFRRQLDFRPIFIAGILANISSFSVAIICALSGLGYMSLAWSSLAGVLVTVGTSILFRPDSFPRWPGITGLRSVVHFGKHASGIYIIGQLGKSAPEIIIGRALDMSSVAFFSRAGGLIEIFHRTVLRAVLPVCLPYFAKSNREDGQIASGYLQSVSYLTAIGWPFFAFLGFAAYAAVRIVYGTQWISSVPLAQILCAAGMVEIVHFLSKEAIIAAGRVDRSNLLQFGVQGSRILGLLLVIPFGLKGAAWGLFIASIFGTIFSQRMLSQTIGLRARDVINACLPNAYITILCSVPVVLWVGIDGVTEENYMRLILGAGFVAITLWLITIRTFQPGIWTEIMSIKNRVLSKLRMTR